VSKVRYAYYIKYIVVSGIELKVNGLYWDSSMPSGRSRGFKGITLTLVGNTLRGVVPKEYGGSKLIAAIRKYLSIDKISEGTNRVDRRFIRR
jgi:hypothetical protein